MICAVEMPSGEIVAHGVFGANAFMDIDFSHVTKKAESPVILWADNKEFTTFKPIEYNPDGTIGCKISLNNDDGTSNIYIEGTQDDFIALARHLNTMKNRILKMRRNKDGTERY